MPVGTRGAIKYLSAADYERLGAQIVLGNTYHLMLRPGAETVARFGGLGAFAGWNGLTLTDSGGFQVFSLDPKVDDDGVTFKSTYDGSKHRFTPRVRCTPRSCSVPTSRWCSTCARRCRRRPR
jgi:queuine tRNA-ribosyltransferase